LGEKIKHSPKPLHIEFECKKIGSLIRAQTVINFLNNRAALKIEKSQWACDWMQTIKAAFGQQSSNQFSVA